MKTLPPDPVKRTLLKLCGALPLFAFVSACSLTGYRSSHHPQLTGRFKGTGGVGVLYVDGLVEKEGVTIYNEHGTPIFWSATLGPRNTSESAYPGGERGVPETVRVTWREGKFTFGTWDWEGGTITGDYTVPVAARIPDAVLDYIRSGSREPYWLAKSAVDGSDVFATPIGRALRLKIRLIDDGVLIGWDVEERIRTKYGTTHVHKMAGGDFRERLIHRDRGKTIVDKGWYIDPHTGQKIETDY